MNKIEYKKIVKENTPSSPILRDCVGAFCIGGLICLIGQVIYNIFGMYIDDTEVVASSTSATLVFIGAFLTGINIYDKIAKMGGAGTLVPITGFANAITSSALESRTEGLVLGVGVGIFKIAGPVILYGILSSILFGIISLVVELF